MPPATNLEDVQVLISADKIAGRRRELAAQISQDYAGEELLLVCILKGSMVFFVDLAREITLPLRFDHIGVSSYSDSTTSTGRVELRTDLSESITGKHVLLVEDIVDTGLTLDFLRRHLADREPASLKVAALLDKPDRRQVEVDVAYTGFTIPNKFVVGYGLDYAGMFRNLPYIGVLESDEFED
jgi:hypoxanthine phosphoribosyltransferase